MKPCTATPQLLTPVFARRSVLSSPPALRLLAPPQDLKNNWSKVQAEVDVPSVQALFKAVDWIGVSAYAALPRFPAVADLETSLKRVDQEMQMFGMSLKGLGKEIIYSEYGEC